MSWLPQAMGFGQTPGSLGAIDPATGYPTPYSFPTGSGVFNPSATSPVPASPGATSSFLSSFSPGTSAGGGGGGMSAQQSSQMQQLMAQYPGLDPAVAYMMVSGQQRPSGWATAAAGLGPVAGATLEAKLNPRHLAEAPPVPVHVEPPGPLPFAGNRDQPNPAVTTASIIASLL